MIELDREIDKVCPGFYTRYGDDLIVADKDVRKTQKISNVIDKVLHDHRLEGKQEKEASLYLTIPGRHPEIDPNGLTKSYTGRDRLTFLGCDIMAQGTIAIGAKLERGIIAEISRRLNHTKRLLNLQNSVSTRGLMDGSISRGKKELIAYCKAVNNMFNPDSPLAHKSAGLLRYAITDRQCLKRLDYCIARAILRTHTNDPSIKRFRQLSIKEMREVGLQSLVHNRNIIGK
jgi:hypothetical protein